MTKRIIQQGLVAERRARFTREASRQNLRAAGAARAEHERHPSTLAATYRLGRPGPRG